MQRPDCCSLDSSSWDGEWAKLETTSEPFLRDILNLYRLLKLMNLVGVMSLEKHIMHFANMCVTAFLARGDGPQSRGGHGVRAGLPAAAPLPRHRLLRLLAPGLRLQRRRSRGIQVVRHLSHIW